MEWPVVSVLLAGCASCSISPHRPTDEAMALRRLPIAFQEGYAVSAPAHNSAPLRVVAGTARVVESENEIHIVQKSENAVVAVQALPDDMRCIVVTSDLPNPCTLFRFAEGLSDASQQLMSRVESKGTVYFIQQQAPQLPKWIHVCPVAHDER